MLSRTIVRRVSLFGVALASLALTITLFSVIPAHAQGRGNGQGNGQGGGHGGRPTSEASNNLSTPTIMIGGGFTGVTCGTPETPSTLVTPTGDPSTGYPIDTTAYYYVQGINTWQAQCYNDTSASVYGAWGDNLVGGEAKLSVGKPIRVELGLYNRGTNAAVTSMDGYSVVKLDPNALDRESAYGTLATGSPDTGFSATATPFASDAWRVYASGVTFSICQVGGSCVVPPGTAASAEINATGNVVYGYNLRVSVPGDYVITFTTPTGVTFTGANTGTASGDTASITITVTSGGGGGGGHGR